MGTERKWHDIAHPVVRTLNGNFLTPNLIILLQKVYNITSNNHFSLRKITTILAQKKNLITTISALNQLLVITNLHPVNPDE